MMCNCLWPFYPRNWLFTICVFHHPLYHHFSSSPLEYLAPAVSLTLFFYIYGAYWLPPPLTHTHAFFSFLFIYYLAPSVWLADVLVVRARNRNIRMKTEEIYRIRKESRFYDRKDFRIREEKNIGTERKNNIFRVLGYVH